MRHGHAVDAHRDEMRLENDPLVLGNLLAFLKMMDDNVVLVFLLQNDDNMTMSKISRTRRR